jgi:hypothetical protein
MDVRRIAGKAVSAALVLLITFVLAEAFLASLRWIPALAGVKPLTPLARELYTKDRAVVAALPDCARWDSELWYTLRPGGCTFENTEFRTTLAINSVGVRDSEEALHGPELIVTGDSFAMGWGVESEERYGERLARGLGLKELNTAIASYGTVRELALLKRVDLSRVRLIVLQFCDNDFEENEAFEKNGRLDPLSRETFERLTNEYALGRRYRPGDYLFRALGSRFWRLTARGAPERREPDPDDPATRRIEVETFCQVLEKSPVDLSRIPVVVLELNSYNLNATWFIPMLEKELASRRHPSLSGRVFPVDVASGLQPGDFFVLDDHLRARGHRTVADILLPTCAARIAFRKGG